MWWRPAWFSLKGKGSIRGQRRDAVLPHPAFSTNQPADPCTTAAVAVPWIGVGGRVIAVPIAVVGGVAVAIVGSGASREPEQATGDGPCCDSAAVIRSAPTPTAPAAPPPDLFGRGSSRDLLD